jgi:ATPase family associated with various cellular activities (AAA)
MVVPDQLQRKAITMSNTITMTDARYMIESHYRRNKALLLLGKPGMGKTSLYESVAHDLGIGFIDFRLTLRDPVDVGGMRIPDEKSGKMKWFCPDDLPDVKKHGPKGIIVFDEINVVSPMMQATAYGIIQERRIGSWRMPDGWVPMASGNNVSDRAAAQRISSALANRFNCQVVEPDLTSWIDQYAAEHVDHRGVAFLRFRPKLFHVMPGEIIEDETAPGSPFNRPTTSPVAKDETAFPSARSWTNAFAFIDEAPAMRRKIIAGYVGPHAANEFEAFWRVYSRMVTLDEIIADPMHARIPSDAEPDVSYALTGMISTLMTPKNSKALFTYTMRLMPEYQAIIGLTATKRNPDLLVAKGYTEWAAQNAAVLV